MLDDQMYNSDLDVSVENHLALSTSKAHDVFRHGDHPFLKEIHVSPCFSELIRVIAPDMINDFVGLGKAWICTSVQLALESHIAMTGFQMAFRVLNIGVTKVTTILVLDRIVVTFGIEVVLSPLSALIPAT